MNALCDEHPPAGVTHKARTLCWFFWIPLLILILYPLSIGPAAKLDSKGLLPLAIYPKLYQPVISLAGGVGLQRALDWYIWDLWNVRGSYPEVSTPPSNFLR